MTLSFTEFFKGCGGYFPFPERKVAIFMEKIFQALICTKYFSFFFGLDFLKLLTHRVSGPLPLDLQLLKSLSLSFLLLQSCLLIMMDGVFKSFRAFRLVQKQVQYKLLYLFSAWISDHTKPNFRKPYTHYLAQRLKSTF